jgi:iron complex outermembrane recepter protein
MKKIFMLLSCLGLTVFAVNAQQISGAVKDAQGKAIEKATVSLLNAKDSSVVKLAVTKADGQFLLSGDKPGSYLVNASHVGHASVYSKVFELSGAGETNLPDIQLTKLTGDLKAVTVTSKKPMVEVKADKTILNVEGTINAVGNDALELLRKSPGVLVDKDENISLAGKNGVQVYVDGKPTPIAGADLAAYLKNMQSSQIEAIEIITNPSAKYDAAGNAGIINIRLKKNKSYGTNGSVNAGYNVGVYGKYNAGLSLNHRDKNVNVFGNYNFNHGLNDNKFNLDRRQLDTLFDQKTNFKMLNTNHGFKAGLDYFIDKKNILGAVINGNISNNEFSNYSVTPISYIPTGIVDRKLVADNSTKADRNNVNFNLNYRYADTAGRELNIDADYGLFRLNTNQIQPNYYFTPDGTVKLNEFIYNFISPTDIDIYTMKADYEQNYKKGKLGLGVKSSLVNTGNNFGRYNVTGSNKSLDLGRSNQFDYSENINAAYVNYNRPFKGFMIQAGLRYEQTTAKGDSYPLNADGSVNRNINIDPFKRNYGGLFPSAAITFNKKPMNQWGISYSRRIDRPAYQDLNPFEFKLDEYTFQKGNTQLRPQYTNTIGITNTYKYKLTTALNYSHVSDVFTQLIDTAEKSKSFITKKNLATQDITSLNISYPFQWKWYGAFFNVNSYYSKYTADFGGGNRKINLDVFAYTFFMQNSFTLGKKGWRAELSGFYASPSIWQGTFESKAIYSIDGGLQKTIFKGKGNLKASVTDIFFTQRWKGTSRFAGQVTTASGNWESRQLRLNLTYRFGNAQVKAARQRKEAAEEEKKRTQGGGGIGNNN